jgi:phenylalanyl-tRNA synthetase alpha chain
MDIEKAVSETRKAFEADLKAASSLKELEELKVKYLGRKGPLQDLMQKLREVAPEKKPEFGKLINDLKIEASAQLEAAISYLQNSELDSRLQTEEIDVTLPGKRRFLARRHVTLKLLDEALDVLISMGFTVQYGPDIESEYYNFEALNFSKDHPARDMQDTFYIAPDILLRTHTSNTQVRIMEAYKPPIRVVMPGTCYRNEDVSARSHVVFHQIEGLYIDKNVTFADLLSTLNSFFTKFLGREIEMRFRPSYFPFVEPGVEVDIRCISCEGQGCNICKKSGWLEVAGAGMVHPEVLKSGGIDPEVYSGYAWGFGIERLTMLRFDIKDIRYFFTDNLRFLQQF